MRVTMVEYPIHSISSIFLTSFFLRFLLSHHDAIELLLADRIHIVLTINNIVIKSIETFVATSDYHQYLHSLQHFSVNVVASDDHKVKYIVLKFKIQMVSCQ